MLKDIFFSIFNGNEGLPVALLSGQDLKNAL
jgi:hypothetical protein